DMEFQKKCLSKMGSAATEGRTVILVSHQLAAVQQLCGRAFLMRSGGICLEGKTGLVVSNYLNDALHSAAGDFELVHHLARSTKHQNIIHRIKLLSSAGDPTGFFYPDDTLIAEITLEPTAPIREPKLALAIEDSLGRRITTVASY